MAGIFGIGISGIQAAQLGLQVTQHNITNSSTPGYNRQSIIQATAIPVGTASGFNGNGTQVTTISRQYNSFLTAQLRDSQTQYSALDAYFTQIQTIDNLLADSNAGVSPALQSFFSAVQGVASTPASLPARQSMVSAAQTLIARFQSANQQISNLYGQINQQLTDDVALINTYGKQIAALNEQITVAESAVNQPANDLLDKRDQLITELNKIVQVQTINMDNGQVQVLVGKGQTLVTGNQMTEMSVVRSSADPSRLSVAIGGQELPESVISGGELGGLLQFRRETLDSAVNTLGQVAATLALTFNAQNANGMDMLGNNSGDSGFVANLFTIPNPKVIPSRSGSPAVSATFTAPTLTSNTVPGNYYTNLTNSDYTLKFSGSSFTLTRLSDNTIWTGATLADINTQINDENDARGAQGFTLTDDGSLYTSGDTYTIQPTREIAKNIGIDSRVVGDVRLIAAGLAVKATVGLTNTGSMSVAVNRVRTDTTYSPGPAYPVKIGISSDGASLTLGDGSGVYDVSNPGPYQMTVYPADGSAATTYTLEYPASATPPLITAGATYEIWDGYSRVQFSITGNPQPGDTFTLDMNDGSTGGAIGVSDTGNILLLGALQTQNTASGGNVTYQDLYAQLVSSIGNKAREIEVMKDAQQALVDQSSEALTSESGVNLDEEAANLLKYQQLYQASSRSISIGQKLFDELLAIANG